jgi:hypothetical protein
VRATGRSRWLVAVWRAHPSRAARPRSPPRRPAHARACAIAAGIKRPKTQRYMSTKGVDPKFLRNQRFAKAGNVKNIKPSSSK